MAFPSPQCSIESTITLPNYCKHDMQFYDDIVFESINLTELEELSIERLLVLGIILKMTLISKRPTFRECRKQLVTLMKKQKLTRFADLCDGKGCDVHTKERRDARKMDNISHNILRLIFAYENETLVWFEKLESIFFRWRLAALDEQGILAFRTINGIKYPTINEDEKKRLCIHLKPLMNEPSLFNSTTFYKVPVLEILDLIKHKTVHMEKGVAYITELQFSYLIYYHFKRRLSSRLENAIGAMPYISADERMFFLRKRLRNHYEQINQLVSWNSEGITVDDLDKLAETSYPPCMRKLHEALKTNNHLRNGGRVQYTLFLKGIGLPAEATVDFYKNIFTKRMTDDAFQKEYVYQFRHMYGLVGSRKDYQNHNCVDIAKQSVDKEDYHGCFFATSDIEDIGKKLNNWKISSKYSREITELVKIKHYGKACSVYFEASHGCSVICPIVKPIDFFGLSRQILKNQEDT